MADYYIDPATGNDVTGSGTSGSPWATLQKGVNSATGGDTIFLANTSPDVFTTPLTWNTGFGATSSGNPLRIAGWDNGGSLVMAMPGAQTDVVVGEVNGNSTVANYDSSSGRPAFVHYIGIRFKDFVPASAQAMVHGIGIYSSFINCEFAGITQFEFGLYAGSTECWVIGCYFHGHPQARGISSGGGHIHGNYFAVHGYAAIISGSKASFCNNIVRSSSTDYDPLVQCNTTNILVANNTFHVDSGVSTAGCITASAEEQVIINNIFSGFNGAGGTGIGNSVNVTGHNCFYNVATSEVAPDYSLGNNVTTDPAFANTATADFTPSGTDVLDSGLPRFPGSETNNPSDMGAVYVGAGGGVSYTPAASAKFTRLE
jgi:hypothetical protein